MTGRRPNYTIFSVDIGVTDVTKNSRLFAVTSTTCSTLLKLVTAVFAPPVDIQEALVQHTQCPCRFVVLATKALYSHKLRDRHMYIHRKHMIPGTYAVYSCVWRLWIVFLGHGVGALGIFKSPYIRIMYHFCNSQSCPVFSLSQTLKKISCNI